MEENMEENMEKKVLEYITKHKLIEQGGTVIVGLSGGADSVCLLYVLCALRKKLGIDVEAVHIHHMIRGKEADEDKEYVEKLCTELGVGLKVIMKDVPRIAKQEKLTLEEAGRKVRYEAFAECAGNRKNTVIAVAHHMNDQAETVLMNMTRGSGIRGLCGIQQKRGNIIRPLLCVKRTDIENYLKERGIQYRTDSTNLSDEYLRNKVRHNIVEYMQREVNAAAVENIAGCASLLSEAETYIAREADTFVQEKCRITEGKVEIPLRDMRQQAAIIQKYVVRRAFGLISHSLKDITQKHIEAVVEIMDMQVGKKVSLPYGMRAYTTYDQLIIRCGQEEKEKKGDYEICVPCRVQGFSFEIMEWNSHKKITANDYTKFFDYDKIKFNLHLRTRQTGDYIIVNQKGNKKTLKSYFIDEKVQRQMRDDIWLLADGNHILWICGYRISEGYKVTADTKKVLCVRMEKNQNEI